MKFKLDENLGSRPIKDAFTDAGHDALTVGDQAMGGDPDDSLFVVCLTESRCLVTLDLDFSNTLRFPPATSAGIAVLRPGREASLGLLVALAQQLAAAVLQTPIDGKLWIVEPGRIRVHETADGHEDGIL